jgi:hypothetical protein
MPFRIRPAVADGVGHPLQDRAIALTDEAG